MIRSYFSAVVAVLVSVILVPVAWGEIMTPTGLTKDQLFRVVFVTNGTTQATSDVATVYDGIVQTAANNALLNTYNNLPVTWQAIVSTPLKNANASDRLPSSTVPWYIMDSGQNWYKVSEGNGWSGSLLHAINLNESGNALTGDTRVWTGTTSLGVASAFPLGSPANMGIRLATFGESSSAGATWIIAGGDNSDPQSAGLHLYGVSQVLTAVPEPGCLTLCLLGLAVGGGYGLLRRKRSVTPSSL